MAGIRQRTSCEQEGGDGMNIALHHQPTQNDISRAKVFADCTDAQCRRLGGLSTVLTVPAGCDLTVQGGHGREFGVIVEGQAVVAVDGHEVARLGAGDHYGELALLDDPMTSRGRRATVTTTVVTTLAVMSVAEFRTLLADMPDVSARIVRTAFARTFPDG
jgi:CRP-like cAMP-binding protein